MALMQKKTPEERALKDEIKKQHQREAAASKEADQLKKLRAEFFASPAGQAQLAFERGDRVFQYAIDVMSQKAIVIKMIGANTSHTTTDPSDILNSVCDQGWELVNGSFVFVELGQESRDKFMSSGQNVAIKGSTVGYYLFKRSEANRRQAVQAWEGATEVSVT
jgi:hypothetical protein